MFLEPSDSWNCGEGGALGAQGRWGRAGNAATAIDAAIKQIGVEKEMTSLSSHSLILLLCLPLVDPQPEAS